MVAMGGGNAPLHADGDTAQCKKLPRVVRLAEPKFPKDFESRGVPMPITVMVEFTVRPDGTSADARAIETHAGGYGPEFEKLAVAAALETRFQRMTHSCRGRWKIVWKLGDS